MTIPGTIVSSIPAIAVPSDQSQPDLGGIASLTSGLSARDDGAFQQFHVLYYDRLLRYLLVLTKGNEQAAQDALQETFVRVARHARRFEESDVFWSWLTVLARSAAMDVLRKSNRYWRLITSYTAAWVGAGSPSIHAEATDDHLLGLLSSGVARLDETEKTLIEGKYLRGLSVRQLAEQCSLTEKAVESRLRRARLQLRRNLLLELEKEQ